MVWAVTKVDFREATLDFTSSGQGLRTDVELLLDDNLFANAVGLTDWSADCFQVTVCGACGVEHCAPGGWVSLRSIGDDRLFLPCFHDLADPEYAPPDAIVARGAPLIAPNLYAVLRARLGLPAAPPPLSLSEAAALVAFEAPRGVVDNSGAAYAVKREPLVAVSEGERDAMVQRLEHVLARFRASEAAAVCRGRRDTDVPVTFYVDGPAYPEWTPLALGDDGAGLMLGACLVVGAGEQAHAPDERAVSE